MKCVDDDSDDDAKEASLDEEGKAPQVQRLHIERRKRAVSPCVITAGTSSNKVATTQCMHMPLT